MFTSTYRVRSAALITALKSGCLPCPPRAASLDRRPVASGGAAAVSRANHTTVQDLGTCVSRPSMKR